MKKKKYLSIVAAALLAVAPVASVPFVAQGQATVVKAASTATSDQLMAAYYAEGEKEANDNDDIFVKITKKTPYITVKSGTTARQITKMHITDINTNHGTLSGITSVQVYNAFDNGSPDLSSEIKGSTKLEAGRNYVAKVGIKVSGLPNDKSAAISESDTSIPTLEYQHWYGSKAFAILLVPIHVTEASTTQSKPATTITTTSTTSRVKTTAKKSTTKKTSKKSKTTKISKHGYVTVRKGYKVKTYTSTGKFSKHYVYRHHTYKLNRKKYIKGHGTCYKIYGKNQWIPGKYLKLKK